MDNDILYSYGVYWAHPPYAHRFVVLRFGGVAGGEIFYDRSFFIGSDSLDHVYEHMRRRGLVMFSPSPEDDPNLIQSWI